MSQPLTRAAVPQFAASARRPSIMPPGRHSHHAASSGAATIRIDGPHATASDPVPPVPAAAPRSERSPQSGHSRIQLRLSRNLVAILKAFAKAGQRPSKMVELSLWSDPQMQDAALLLGIQPPDAVRKRRLHRIRPKSTDA